MSPDQTPTPTKFLKNCEEVGLFQELSKNPFEEAFKKASDTDVSSIFKSILIGTINLFLEINKQREKCNTCWAEHYKISV